jgi:GT2 family glycosyltransferase
MSESTKIGIVISTWQRPDGKTPELLKRTLTAINNQTYKNWKVYLIGDNYINRQEFDSLAKIIPSDKILAINLPVAVERERYPNKGENLWFSGGVNATTIGIEFSINQGYDYIAYCDHDELWHNNHLESIAECIKETNSLFLYTKGHYQNMILPRNIDSDWKYIKRRALPNDVIKSSCCINFKKLNLRPRDPLYFYNEITSGDTAFLIRVNSLLDKLGEDSILINKVTITNDQEGYTKTL